MRLDGVGKVPSHSAVSPFFNSKNLSNSLISSFPSSILALTSQAHCKNYVERSQMLVLMADIKVQVLSFYRSRGDSWITSDWRKTMNSAG